MNFDKIFIIFLSLLTISIITNQSNTVIAKSNIARYAPFGYAISAGLVDNWKLVRAHGENPSVDVATTPEDIWEIGGVYPFPSSAQTTTIVSSSASDDVGGTGCSAANVSCLNNQWIEIEIPVTLDGLTPVALSSDCFRVNDLFCTSSGTNKTNIGNIDVKHGATILRRIKIGKGESQASIFSVPAGKSWFIDKARLELLATKTTAVTAELQTRSDTSNTWRSKLTFGVISEGNSSSANSPPEGRPLLVGEKTDIRMRVLSTDTNGARIHSDITGLTVPTSYPNI